MRLCYGRVSDGPSHCLSHQSIAAEMSSWFVAAFVSSRYQSVAAAGARAQQQAASIML